MANNLRIDRQNLNNESDVEQKLIYPLLTLSLPIGLGFRASNIRTKPSIKSFEIEKRKNKKRYYPDYVIVVAGFPLLIIEAKPPSETLEEAYREARLYCTELNAIFPHTINPATRVMCTNGIQLIAGMWDEDIPKYQLKIEDIYPSNTSFFDFANNNNLSKLEKEALKLNQKIYKEEYYQPLKFVGGSAVRSEEIGTNSFGNIIALEYQHIFNPISPEERKYIVENAYIVSKNRQRHIDPIDRIVRAAIPPSESDSKVIYSEKPQKLLEQLKKSQQVNLEHKVLLLIGGVGTGKSTFVDYLKYKALDKELLKSTVWLRVDMNDAPLNKEKIYDWICEQIIDEFQIIYPEYDFDELEILLKIFAVEVNKFRKGRGKLLEGTDQYNIELYKEIEKLQKNKKVVVKSYLRFLCSERGKLGIVVLDNCDKRIRDEQLLMFQAAQWIQHEFRCLIFLPIRDITYDNHRHEPPLDTALKDLVFRIEPPRFQDVLVARIRLAFKEMQRDSHEKTLTYTLSNTIKVSFPAKKLAYFLTSILKSLFEHDKYLRWIIVGLAGKDIRKAIEIFLDFCKSGHITEDEFFKIFNAKGKYSIPFDVVSRVLMRMNRRFYSGNISYIKNIFYCNPEDSKPFLFTRFAILRWLLFVHEDNTRDFKERYRQVCELKADLYLLGLSEDVINRELIYLLKSKCIFAEHLRMDNLDDNDLISLAPAGYVHLELVDKVDYLASISEETFFNNQKNAREISSRINDTKYQYLYYTSLKNSHCLIEYIRNEYYNKVNTSNQYLECFNWQESLSIDYLMDKINSLVDQEINKKSWYDIELRINENDIKTGSITKITNFGIFVLIDNNNEVSGLIHKSNLGFRKLDDFTNGEKVKVRVIKVNSNTRRLELALIDKI